VIPSRGNATAPQPSRGRICREDVVTTRVRFASSSRLLFFLLACVALFFFSGCSKKTLSKSELHSITDEIVGALGRVNGPPVAVRKDIKQPFTSDMGGIAADQIYVTLSNSSQANGLRAPLAAIARRHHLTLMEASSANLLRFDFAFEGHRTQSVHIVTRLSVPERVPLLQHGHTVAPRLAIILDDLGYDRAAADSLLALPFPLTVSVLPHLPLSTEVAEEASRRGDQVLLHLPMQSEGNGAKTEEVELRVGMTEAQVDTALAGMLETVPGAAGVNNHQGSRATADPVLMAELMPALRSRNLFFIDSRTTASTVAYDAAVRAGVPTASRKVFLDDTQTREAILAQIDLAARDALRDGTAIAIGHPHPATIAALSEEIPRLEARGIRMVYAADLLR
jgi:polysaccharide deacetylase 2 family uncharacterized protein YibQ